MAEIFCEKFLSVYVMKSVWNLLKDKLHVF
mgnify:CR=1 FL=1